MPDKKLTDIKELLKYKAKVGCQNCDLIGKGCCSTCVNSLIKQFIELFDRLQAENERLKNAYKQCAWERDCFEADNKRLYEIIENKNIKTEEQ